MAARRAGESHVPSVRQAATARAAQSVSALREVLEATQQRAAREAFDAAVAVAELRAGKGRVPSMEWQPPNPWKTVAGKGGPSALAARARNILRNSPTGFVAETLILEGMARFGEELRSRGYGRKQRLKGEGFPLYAPAFGDLVIPNYVEVTDMLAAIYPENEEWYSPVAAYLEGAAGVPVITDHGDNISKVPGTWTAPEVFGDSGIEAKAYPIYAGFPDGWTLMARAWLREEGSETVIEDQPVGMRPIVPLKPYSRVTVKQAAAIEKARQRRRRRMMADPLKAMVLWPLEKVTENKLARRALVTPHGVLLRQVMASIWHGHLVSNEADVAEIPPSTPIPPEFTFNPGVRAREKKIKTGLWRKGALVQLLEGLLEGRDAIEALWLALPLEVRKAYRQRWVEGEFERGVQRPSRKPPVDVMVDALLNHWNMLDADGVMRELAWEKIEDTMYGYVGKRTGEALGGIERSQRGTVSPDVVTTDGEYRRNEHVLSPRLPTEALENWVTGRAERQREQSQRPDVVSFAIAERQRRRQARSAESARRARYRERFGASRIRR